MINIDAFFKRIKILVPARNITVEALCQMANFKLGSYNSAKYNKNLLRADVTLRIAQILGISVEFLLTGEEESDEITQTG